MRSTGAADREMLPCRPDRSTPLWAKGRTAVALAVLASSPPAPLAITGRARARRSVGHLPADLLMTIQALHRERRIWRAGLDQIQTVGATRWRDGLLGDAGGPAATDIPAQRRRPLRLPRSPRLALAQPQPAIRAAEGEPGQAQAAPPCRPALGPPAPRLRPRRKCLPLRSRHRRPPTSRRPTCPSRQPPKTRDLRATSCRLATLTVSDPSAQPHPPRQSPTSPDRCSNHKPG
jgi:hypothetical protein